MPAKGFKCLTIKEDLYKQLLEISKNYSNSLQDTLESMIKSRQMSINSSSEHSHGEGPRFKSGRAHHENFYADGKKFYQKDSKLHQPRNGYSNARANFTVNLDEFLQFCRVDLHLAKKTIVRNKSVVRRVLQQCGPDPSIPQLRSFLGTIENDSTRDNYIKALRTYFRDYKNDFERVRTFRLANRIVIPSWCPSKKDLQVFYSELDDPKEKALFLFYASSGKRRNEVLELTLKDVDIANRVIYPNKESCSKRTWYSFFNQECQDALYDYLKVRRDPSRCGRLFPLSNEYGHCLFKLAQQKTNLYITPKVLRLWFCCEMSRLGISDRFIDAFCGRVPRSVFARHYTDYSLESLKAVYDKANIQVSTTP